MKTIVAALFASLALFGCAGQVDDSAPELAQETPVVVAEEAPGTLPVPSFKIADREAPHLPPRSHMRCDIQTATVPGPNGDEAFFLAVQCPAPSPIVWGWENPDGSVGMCGEQWAGHCEAGSSCTVPIDGTLYTGTCSYVP